MLKLFKEIESKSSAIMDEQPHFEKVGGIEVIRKAIVRHHGYRVEFIEKILKELGQKRRQQI